MVLKIVVAGVIGYPAKNRHPEFTAPQAIASLPSIKDNGISRPPPIRYFFSLVSERKLEIFSKVKEDEDFNRKNILNILRIKI